jgi:hypothetical protein
LISAHRAAPPDSAELAALVRLLDDETPEVRQRVTSRIALCGGDLSEWLAAHPRELSARERELLVEMLRPARQENLARDWVAPTGGAAALQEDWETFEALLRVISDFLHDGITLRQPLSDALDLLAEEAEESGVTTARGLKDFLFPHRLEANVEGYYDPRNSDLAWCVAAGRSNPLGLCLILILVARRLELEAEGVNFPGHFMCRIFEDGYPIIIDCFDNGRMHLQATLLESPELGRRRKAILRETAGPGEILVRLLANLRKSLEDSAQPAEAALVAKLCRSLA